MTLAAIACPSTHMLYLEFARARIDYALSRYSVAAWQHN
ncbi:hypothetical protein PSAC2689_40528 [Paraburkholderia sacchari]